MRKYWDNNWVYPQVKVYSWCVNQFACKLFIGAFLHLKSYKSLPVFNKHGNINVFLKTQYRVNSCVKEERKWRGGLWSLNSANHAQLSTTSVFSRGTTCRITTLVSSKNAMKFTLSSLIRSEGQSSFVYGWITCHSQALDFFLHSRFYLLFSGM